MVDGVKGTVVPMGFSSLNVYFGRIVHVSSSGVTSAVTM
jgi:hypothetical protein